MLENCKQMRLFLVPKELVFAGMLLQRFRPAKLKLVIPGDFGQYNKRLDKVHAFMLAIGKALECVELEHDF